MKFNVSESLQIASLAVAKEINQFVSKNQRGVLGLATGNSVIRIYQNLVELAQKNNTSYNDIVTFNLDEYVGFLGKEPQSFKSFMHNMLFNQLNFNLSNCHFPNATGNLERNCENYENLIEKKGPIDLQLLGVGINGHIGFNEPGSEFECATHVQRLELSTLKANAKAFGDFSKVPKQAITMGIKTILSAKKIILVAFGKNKHFITNYIYRNASGTTYNPKYPVSALFHHPDVTVYCDNDAIGDLLKS